MPSLRNDDGGYAQSMMVAASAVCLYVLSVMIEALFRYSYYLPHSPLAPALHADYPSIHSYMGYVYTASTYIDIVSKEELRLL